MALESKLFKRDAKLQARLTNDTAHIARGAVGDHVRKIQTALKQIDNVSISPTELLSAQYGPSAASSVLTYEQLRDIVNKSYQTQADNIVGKMTIAALDTDMLGIETGVVAKAFPTIPEAQRLVRLAIARLTAVRASYSSPDPLPAISNERHVLE